MIKRIYEMITSTGDDQQHILIIIPRDTMKENTNNLSQELKKCECLN